MLATTSWTSCTVDANTERPHTSGCSKKGGKNMNGDADHNRHQYGGRCDNNAKNWTQHISTACDNRKVSDDTTHLTNVLQTRSHYGTRRWTPAQQAMQPPLQEDLLEGERRKPRHMSYQERDRIEQQKTHE